VWFTRPLRRTGRLYGGCCRLAVKKGGHSKEGYSQSSKVPKKKKKKAGAKRNKTVPTRHKRICYRKNWKGGIWRRGVNSWLEKKNGSRPGSLTGFSRRPDPSPRRLHKNKVNLTQKVGVSAKKIYVNLPRLEKMTAPVVL